MMKSNHAILGIHCGYQHDAGAALVVDGEIVAAVAEERMTRQKKDPYFPEKAIQKCLEIGECGWEAVKLIALGTYEIQFQPFQRSREYFDRSGGFFTRRANERSRFDRIRFGINRLTKLTPFKSILVKKLENMGATPKTPLIFLDHHSCHMASVYFTSGALVADSGYIFSIDGKGDDKSVSVYKFSDNGFPEVLTEMPPSSSPGILYQGVTVHLGMKPNRHEGKVTGLAAFGDKSQLIDIIGKYLLYDRTMGRFQVPFYNEAWVKKLPRRVLSLVWNHFLHMQRPNFRLGSVLDQMKLDFEGCSKEDIAAATQAKFDSEIGSFVRDVIGDDSPESILLVGGIFANVKTNEMIAETYPSAQIYVHPGMTDEGIALGAALYGSYVQSKTVRRVSLDHVYYGSNYDDTLPQYISELNENKYEIRLISRHEPSDLKMVAELISDGKLVGLFQGSMEYGPRALGNRTILADPRHKEMHQILNKRLRRTEYMPFAPVVMAEYAERVFDFRSENSLYAANFMTITTRVRSGWLDKIEAVVHVDNTARPQIIGRGQNPFYYDILNAYCRITGIPVLINTSFNIHEEPIVEKPEDAIRALDLDAIDYVCFPTALISMKTKERP